MGLIVIVQFRRVYLEGLSRLLQVLQLLNRSAEVCPSAS